MPPATRSAAKSCAHATDSPQRPRLVASSASCPTSSYQTSSTTSSLTWKTPYRKAIRRPSPNRSLPSTPVSYVTVTIMWRNSIAQSRRGGACPPLSGSRGRSETPSPTLSNHRGFSQQARRPRSHHRSKTRITLQQQHSQIVPENGAESDCSHVFPDYSQLVPDRTEIDLYTKRQSLIARSVMRR